MTQEEKDRTIIVEWADTQCTTVTTYKTVEQAIQSASIAKMLGAKVCFYSYISGWVWA